MFEELQTEENRSDHTYLTFWISGQLFGFQASDVSQIVGMQSITPIPEFPKYAKGIINLRGEIIPVIDVRLRFHREEIAYDEHTCIIVTTIQDRLIGFIVDTVDAVSEIGAEMISPPPRISGDITNVFVTGVAQLEEKIILLLDTEKILTEDELSVVTQAQKTAAEQPDETHLIEPEQSDETVCEEEPKQPEETAKEPKQSDEAKKQRRSKKLKKK